MFNILIETAVKSLGISLFHRCEEINTTADCESSDTVDIALLIYKLVKICW